MNTTTTTTAGGNGNGAGAPEQERAPGSGTGRVRRQVRLRLTPTLATQLHALPHRARAEAVALTLNASLAGIDVARLLGYRQQLVNLGNLINQSLRVSRGQLVNLVALQQAMAVLKQLTQK